MCGTKLIEPGDTRAFALKVPAEKRHYETDPDVAKVTCGSCKRNREYAKATGATAPPCQTEPSASGAAGRAARVRAARAKWHTRARAPEPPPCQDRRPARRPRRRRPGRCR